MCASFQLIASYTSHWTWGVRFYEDSRNFFLTLPNGNEESALAKHPADFLLLLSTADEKCVWEKIGTLFWKAFLTLHYRGFESRLGEKTENFFEKFSVPTTYWRLIPGLAENFWIFLSSLATGHEKCVWSQIMKILSVTPIWRWEKRFEEGFRNYVLTLPNGHEKCVWAKKSETFSSFFCSHFPLEARCLSGPLFGSFFFFTYMGKMSTPSLPLPTGGKATVWTKKGCCYPNLFLTGLSGQEKVSWPKTLNIFLFPPSTRDEKVKWSAFQEIFILLPISLKSGFPP